MANEEHLKILLSGVERWNEWREQNREIRPDLSNANLSGTNLSGANLLNSKNIFLEVKRRKAFFKHG